MALFGLFKFATNDNLSKQYNEVSPILIKRKKVINA